jgi:hypothetical protein
MTCPGGLILHFDGMVAGCTLDDDVDGCVGLDERHEDAPSAPRVQSRRSSTDYLVRA